MPLRPSPKLKPDLWDGLVALLVVALAMGCGALLFRERVTAEVLTAVVTADGETVEQISLTDPARQTYTVQSCGYTLLLAAQAGEIWVERADCPSQDCVHTGHIARSGQSIVCLPARVIVRLEGGPAAGGVDAVTG